MCESFYHTVCGHPENDELPAKLSYLTKQNLNKTNANGIKELHFLWTPAKWVELIEFTLWTSPPELGWLLIVFLLWFVDFKTLDFRNGSWMIIIIIIIMSHNLWPCLCALKMCFQNALFERFRSLAAFELWNLKWATFVLKEHCYSTALLWHKYKQCLLNTVKFRLGIQKSWIDPSALKWKE